MAEGYWGDQRYEAGVDVRGALSEVPDEFGVEVCGSNINEDLIYWGKTYETGEPVIVKDGSIDSGNAVPSNLFMYEIFSETSVKVPDVGYSEEKGQIYVEILEGYDGSRKGLKGGNREDLLECIAAKALMGDSDFMHNIGLVKDRYAVIDPDRAGAPDFTVEEDVSRYLETLNKGASFDLEKSEVKEAMERVSNQIGSEDLDCFLSSLSPLEEEIPDYANFEQEFLRDNFRKAAEGRPFT